MGRSEREGWASCGLKGCHGPYWSVQRILQRDLRKIYGWARRAETTCPAETKRKETGALCADSRGRARVPTTRDPATLDHACFLSPSTPQDFLQGDCSKAKQKLNWKPRVAFDVSVLFTVEPVGLLAPGPVWASPAEGDWRSRQLGARGGQGRAGWRPPQGRRCHQERVAETPPLPLTPCPGSQELVREMVDADVELMRNNPNA